MGFNSKAAKGETQPKAIFSVVTGDLGESVENVVADFLRNAWPRVGNGDEEMGDGNGRLISDRNV